MLVPWAKRLFLIDHYKPGGVGIPKKGERGEDEEVWARWDEWFGAAVERDSVKATWSEDDKYIEAYKRYAEDTTQSEVGKATRQGRILPQEIWNNPMGFLGDHRLQVILVVISLIGSIIKYTV
jgi:glutathione S-transferase